MKRLATAGAAAAIVLLSGAAAAFGQSGDQEGGLWLPYGASSYTGQIDFLYRFIFWLTGGMFILVEGLLLLFCILYRRRPGHRAQYTHGSNAAELAWTITPALMLLGLAIWQIPTWTAIKSEFPKPGPKVTEVDVMAEQYKWNFRYRLSDDQKKKLDTEYDVTAMSLHMPFGNTMLAHLRSKDVIHSLFIPHMRVKQDTVPGIRNRIWFQPTRIQLIKVNKQAAAIPNSEFVWVDNAADFEPGGKYWSSRIAVSAVSGYTVYRTKDVDKDRLSPAAFNVMSPVFGKWKVKAGSYAPLINPTTGEIRSQKVLHEGKVSDKQAWESCDYAIGIFDVACAELCGMGHYTMNSTLVVEPKPSYDNWLEGEAGSEPGSVWKLWRD